MKNWKLTAAEVELISAWMMVQKYERLLVRGWISDGARQIYRTELNNWRRKYLDILRKSWKLEEYEAYCEREADLQMEEQWLEERWYLND